MSQQTDLQALRLREMIDDLACGSFSERYNLDAETCEAVAGKLNAILLAAVAPAAPQAKVEWTLRRRDEHGDEGIMVLTDAEAERCRAALAAPALSQQPKAHGHNFREFTVCTICGQTEAAIYGCHHCDEPRDSGRCWWCLKPQRAVAEAGADPQEKS